MINASPELVALLNSGAPFVMADLYTFTLNGGTILRYSGADVAITLPGPRSFIKGPLIQRSSLTMKVGVEVSTLDLVIIADESDLIAGVPALHFIRGKGLDGAEFILERAFMPQWGDSVTGSIVRFAGRVTQVPEVGRTQASITVSDWRILWNVHMPSSLNQPPCLNVLYGPDCTLDAADWAVTGEVTAEGDELSFTSDLTQDTGYFSQGVIVFTSGTNNGLKRTVRSQSDTGGVSVVLRFPLPPQAGDTFTIYPGCDLTKGTCAAKFSNLINFRGQPFIPVAETSV